MPHDIPLITTIVAALSLAFFLGVLANHFRISPLVGYLAAGIMIGPYTPGFVGHTELAGEHLLRYGADKVIVGEREIAAAMVGWLTRTCTSST
jgi:predicted Kef-type K+ transport protein